MWTTEYGMTMGYPDKWEQTSTSDMDVSVECAESGAGCCRLCYDCESGSYCWDSDMNENKNS